MIAAPPDDTGAVHDTTTDRSPDTPDTPVGAPGFTATTTIVINPLDAFGNVPFTACTRNEYDPTVVGVPDNTPPEDKLNPGGKLPLAFVNVTGVDPDTRNAYDNADPTFTEPAGDAAVNTGAVVADTT